MVLIRGHAAGCKIFNANKKGLGIESNDAGTVFSLLDGACKGVEH